MRNLDHYTGDAIAFFDEVVKKKSNTKKDPDFKSRIAVLRNDIKKQFNEYDVKFSINELHELESLKIAGEELTDLHRLYHYQSSVIQALKKNVTTTATNRIIATCQNCTLSEINSFDHFLPKQIFSEFVVNPKNLFPSCTVCNGKKSVSWLKDSSRLFLNLYLDKLPDIQYLFVDIIISGDELETKFFLKNTGIDKHLFGIIESHYENLDLFKRFSENNDSVITPLKNNIDSFIKSLSLAEIIDTNNEKIGKDKRAFGANYWKSILESALLNHKQFTDQFKSP